MSPVPEPDAPTESLPRLLLGLVWQLAVLVLPILLVASLPLAGAAASVVALALVLIVVARWPRIGKGVSSLLTSGVIGAAFSLGAALPGYWGLGAGVLWVFIGLASAATLERRLGLASAPVTAEPIGPVDAGARGASAWGGGELLTPEGEPVRTLGWGEIAMGGPVYTDYLMPDGVLLEGLGSSARFSDDGRYFAAPIPSRGAWSLAVFDRQLRRLYHCANDAFWELDAFSGGELRGRHSPLVSDQGYRLSLDAVLREATCEDFVAIGDLWLAPGWAERQQQAVLDLSPPPAPIACVANPGCRSDCASATTRCCRCATPATSCGWTTLPPACCCPTTRAPCGGPMAWPSPAACATPPRSVLGHALSGSGKPGRAGAPWTTGSPGMMSRA